jgi:hypothetical protein
VGDGDATGITAVTSDPEQSGAANYAFKSSAYAGFDFATVWASAGGGYRPELYGVSGVVGISGGSRYYGDSNPDFYTVLGTGYWNTLTGTPVFDTTADATSNVGTYDITGSGATATRMQGGAARIVYIPATLSVTARPITVTADDLSRYYGNDYPVLTYTVGGSGLVNGDTLSGALATTASSTSSVGTYSITQNTLGASSNYNITLFTPGTLTVTARPIMVTADNLSRAYGAVNPALTYTVGGSGLVNFDTLSGALYTSATLSSLAGPYPITQGTLAASSNYAMTFIPGTLTVTSSLILVPKKNPKTAPPGLNGTTPPLKGKPK